MDAYYNYCFGRMSKWWELQNRGWVLRFFKNKFSYPTAFGTPHDLIKLQIFFLLLCMLLPYRIREAADETLLSPFDVRKV